jgi:Mce-associated membrane protein
MATTETRRPVRRRVVVRSMAASVEPAEDVEEVEDANAVEDAKETQPKRKRAPAGPTRLRKAVTWAVLAILVAAVVAGGLLGRRWYDQRQLAQARSEALAAARQTCVNFVSISASTVDADLRRIADGATGQFKDEFTQDTAQVKAAVVQNKVDSHGTVLRAGIVSADQRSAVVLVAVDATVKNTSAPDGRLSHYRIQVNMARDAASGRWLVAQLQFVG